MLNRDRSLLNFTRRVIVRSRKYVKSWGFPSPLFTAMSGKQIPRDGSSTFFVRLLIGLAYYEHSGDRNREVTCTELEEFLKWYLSLACIITRICLIPLLRSSIYFSISFVINLFYLCPVFGIPVGKTRHRKTRHPLE